MSCKQEWAKRGKQFIASKQKWPWNLSENHGGLEHCPVDGRFLTLTYCKDIWKVGRYIILFQCGKSWHEGADHIPILKAVIYNFWTCEDSLHICNGSLIPSGDLSLQHLTQQSPPTMIHSRNIFVWTSQSKRPINFAAQLFSCKSLSYTLLTHALLMWLQVVNTYSPKLTTAFLRFSFPHSYWASCQADSALRMPSTPLIFAQPGQPLPAYAVTAVEVANVSNSKVTATSDSVK